MQFPKDLYISYDVDKLKKAFGLTHGQALHLTISVNWHRGKLADACISANVWKKIEYPTVMDAQGFLEESYRDNPLRQFIGYKVGSGAGCIAMRNLAKKNFIEIKTVTYEKDFPEIYPSMLALVKNGTAKLREMQRPFDIWIPSWEGFHNPIQELTRDVYEH